MNVHPAPPTDPDAFLRWNEGREGKYELVRGRVVQNMIRVTLQHARVAQNLMFLLRTALDPTQYETFMVDVGIRTPEGVRYPDVIVAPAGGHPKQLAATSPILVCEVLSPSSIAIDMVEKPAEYTGIPSVQAYLVLAQDEPRGWLWTRERSGWSGPVMYDGADALIPIPALSLDVPLGAMYPALQLP
jgi:Uma2 family endonuclease